MKLLFSLFFVFGLVAAQNWQVNYNNEQGCKEGCNNCNTPTIIGNSCAGDKIGDPYRHNTVAVLEELDARLSATLPVIELRNSDFATGTYRTPQSAVYKLMEDIVFNPNPNDGWLPTQAQTDSGAYPAETYQLGFFAGIAVEHSNVVIDLNGHEIRQHRDFYLVQRFWSAIDSNQPFPNNEGPAVFTNLKLVSGLIIKNGRMGLTSHHGIHLNEPTLVLIKDIVFHEFEVAAISINGADRIVVRDCEMRGSSKIVPVNGLFSASWFLRPFLRRAAADPAMEAITLNLVNAELEDGTFGPLVVTASSALARIENALNAMITEWQTGTPSTSNDVASIRNPSGLPDGGDTMGIILNKVSVAVGGITTTIPNDVQASNDVTLLNCDIADIVGAATEFMAVADGPGPTHGRDPVGAVVDVLRIIRLGNPIPNTQPQELETFFKGNMVANAQILLGKIQNTGNFPNFHWGRQFMPPAFVNYAESNPQITAQQFFANNPDLRIIDQGDQMFHFVKGTHGVRLTGLVGVRIADMHISDVHDKAPPFQALPFRLVEGVQRFHHPGAAAGSPGYQGALARGTLIGSCVIDTIDGLTIETITSEQGIAVPYDSINEVTTKKAARVIIRGNNVLTNR